MFNSSAFQSDIDAVFEAVRKDMATVRTGRAKPSLVEDVKVEAYGSIMRLVELASISAPDPNSIVISPWDKSVLKNIEKGIMNSGLNLTGVNEGEQIRIPVPPLTEERRREMVKIVEQKEHGGIEMIRSVRQDHKKQIDVQKGQPGVSEDDLRLALEQLQKATDHAIEKLKTLTQEKTSELMQM